MVEISKEWEEVKKAVKNRTLLFLELSTNPVKRIDWKKVRADLSEPQKALFDSRKRLNIFLGGQGVGKSHELGVIAMFFATNFPEILGLICANTYGQLNDSTLYRIREVWEDTFGIIEYDESTGEGDYVIGRQPPKGFDTKNHNFKRYTNIISFKWGAVIFIRSLDNFKAIDGMEVGWCLLDETKDTKPEAIKEVLMGRVRQKGIYLTKTGKITLKPTKITFNPIYIVTSPPRDQFLVEWFNLELFEFEIKSKIYSKTDFFSKNVSDFQFVVISSAYHNQKNLPADFIENQILSLPSHLINMLIYGDPFSKAGGEIYTGFDRQRNIKEINYIPSLPLLLSWDFNVSPYVTCLIAQAYNTNTHQYLFFIDEVCSEAPRNNTPDTCDTVIAKYRSHNAGVWVFGDPSGSNDDTRSSSKDKEKRNDYKIILSKVKNMGGVSYKVARSHPRIVPRVNFINGIFEFKQGNIVVYVHPRCKNLIADLSYTKEDSDGTKLKKKVKDSETGKTYEEYGHTSDALDYIICRYFHREYKRYTIGK